MNGRQFLYIIIATFIAIVVWVTFDIVREQMKTTTSPEAQQLLTPISPDFDQEVINGL